MKTLMFALLGLAPNVVAWNYAVAGPERQDGKQVVVQKPGDPTDAVQTIEWVSDDGQQIDVIAKTVVFEGQGEDGDVQVIELTGGPGEVEDEVIVTADAQVAGNATGEPTVKKIRVITKPGAGDPDAAQRGWLGVSIEVVSDSMAAQLGTQKQGVMVGNVVGGSPADMAGIQPNDMIVSINGVEVAGDLGPAVDLIKSRKPGETINVGILRDGQAMTLSATLGSRADMKNFEWKFEGMPAQVEEQIKTRGKFMSRGPDGELIIQDLGAIDDLKNLPSNIRMFVPQSGTRSTQVFVENGQKTIKMDIEKDGSTVSIEQEGGGPITVSRSENGGPETVATYENEDALKAGDEDAYDMYSQAGHNVFVHVDGDGDGDAPHIFIQGDGDFNWTGDAGQWKAHLEESLGQAKEAYSEAMQELHKNLMDLKNEGTFDVEKFHELLNTQGGNGVGHAFTFNMGKPKHRFDVSADGSIEVSIRKGDSEMTQLFNSEADMAKRRPDLYEKYQSVKAADEE